MIYVFEGGSVVYDATTITQEQKEKAVAVTSLPTMENISGKMGVLKADKPHEKVWYEYVDIPPVPEIEQLKQTVADLTELVLKGVSA